MLMEHFLATVMYASTIWILSEKLGWISKSNIKNLKISIEDSKRDKRNKLKNFKREKSRSHKEKERSLQCLLPFPAYLLLTRSREPPRESTKPWEWLMSRKNIRFLEDLKEALIGWWSIYSRPATILKDVSVFSQIRYSLKTEMLKLSSKWTRIIVWHQLLPLQSSFKEISTKNFTRRWESENVIIWVSSKWNTEQIFYKTLKMI